MPNSNNPAPTAFSRRAALAAALAASVRTPMATTAQIEPSAATAACPQLMVPAYFDPGPEWDRLVAAAPVVRFVIINPNSGPGEVPDPAIQESVQRIQTAGIDVLGYVYTDLARTDPEIVKAEIRAYQEWYRVDGMHVDGVQDDAWAIPYYADLSEVIRAGGRPARPSRADLPGIVVLNPGYVPDEGFMAIADIIETYEWYDEKYPGQEFPDWLQNYPADRFAHIVRNTPDSLEALNATLALMRQRNVGYVYVTERTDPGEYRELPSFWDALVAGVSCQ